MLITGLGQSTLIVKGNIRPHPCFRRFNNNNAFDLSSYGQLMSLFLCKEKYLVGRWSEGYKKGILKRSGFKKYAAVQL